MGPMVISNQNILYKGRPEVKTFYYSLYILEGIFTIVCMIGFVTWPRAPLLYNQVLKIIQNMVRSDVKTGHI